MQKKRAFTLLEVLIVIFVLATGIMVVIQGVNKTTSYISESAQRTIALNLAKEGIEAVYNIRNTNWRKWPNQKDECWLVADPSAPSESNCDAKLGKGRWVLSLKGQSSSAFVGFSSITKNDTFEEDASHVLNFKDFKEWLKRRNIIYPSESELLGNFGFNSFTQGHYQYYLPYLEGTGRVSQPEFKALKNAGASITDSRKLGEYRRYLSFADPVSKVENCSAPNCAKELRFCSIVFYTAPYQGIVKVCSMMTNFEKSSSEI